MSAIVAESDPRYQFLSPFAPFVFRRDGTLFKCIYQYYVYKKFAQSDPVFARGVLATTARKQLTLLSNSRRNKIQAGWDGLKEGIIRDAYRQRFAPGTPEFAKLADLPREPIVFTMPEFAHLGGRNIIGAVINEIRGIAAGAAGAAGAEIRGIAAAPPEPLEDNVCADMLGDMKMMSIGLESIAEVAEGKYAEYDDDEPAAAAGQMSPPAPAAPQLLSIAVDGKPIDGGISLPLSTFKRIVKKDVPDKRLIAIARMIVSLGATYKICVLDSDNWYGPILAHIVAVIAGGAPPRSDSNALPTAIFAAELIERNKIEFA